MERTSIACKGAHLAEKFLVPCLLVIVWYGSGMKVELKEKKNAVLVRGREFC